jgi:hypothetical protein
MKTKLIKNETAKFKPIKMELTIESMEELVSLEMALYLSGEEVNNIIHENYDDFDDCECDDNTYAELWLLFNDLRNELKQ